MKINLIRHGMTGRTTSHYAPRESPDLAPGNTPTPEC